MNLSTEQLLFLIVVTCVPALLLPDAWRVVREWRQRRRESHTAREINALNASMH